MSIQNPLITMVEKERLKIKASGRVFVSFQIEVYESLKFYILMQQMWKTDKIFENRTYINIYISIINSIAQRIW